VVAAAGAVLIAGDDNRVRLWDCDTGVPMGKPLTGPGTFQTVRALAFSPAASPHRLLAAACEGGVWLWDLGGDTKGPLGRAGIAVATPPAYEAVVTLAATGEGRTWLAVADSMRLHDCRRIWVRQLDADTEVWQPFTLPQNDGPWNADTLLTSGYSADGVPVIAAAVEGSSTVWLMDAESGATTITSLPPGLTTVAAGATTDGRLLLLTAANDGARVQVWDPQSGATVGKLLPLTANDIEAAAFGAVADGRTLLATVEPGTGPNPISPSARQAKTVRLWDVDSGICLASIRRRADVNVLALHRSQLVIGDDEGVVMIEVPLGTPPAAP